MQQHAEHASRPVRSAGASCRRSAQQRFDVGHALVVAPVAPARACAAHRRCRDSRAAPCAASQSLRPCARRAGDRARPRPAARPGSCSNQLLEGLVRLVAASERGERLPELLARERQVRLEPDRRLEARHCLLEALAASRGRCRGLRAACAEFRLQRKRAGAAICSASVVAATAWSSACPSRRRCSTEPGSALEVVAAD